MGAEARKWLGGQLHAGDESLLAYSRDSLAGPLRELEKLYSAIQSGEFNPDCDRSGRWRDLQSFSKSSGNSSSSSDDTNSSSGSSTDTSGSDEVDDRAAMLLEKEAEKRNRKPRVLLGDDKLFKHSSRGTYHLLRRDANRLCCGRKLDNMKECIASPRLLVPRCATCFEGADLEGSDSE